MKHHKHSLSAADAAAHELRKREAVASLLISVLVMSVVIIVLAMITLHLAKPEPIQINARIPTVSTENPTPRKHVELQSQRKPSADSAPAPRVIATTAIAPISFPTDNLSPDMPFEPGNGTALGMGSGFGGPGDGDKDGQTTFGYTSERPGTLSGHLYDFKQNADGSPVDYNTSSRADFTSRIEKIHRSRFSENSLKDFFQAPRELYLTHLAVPFSPASAGPGYFGAEKTIKPSGWLAHYSGRIVAAKTGRYRFVGVGDDYLSVFVKRKARLIAAWSDIQSTVADRWDASEPTGEFASPFDGMRLVYGDWISLRAGEAVDIDIAAGERPGGKVGFVLMIEEKDWEYRTASDGRPILPLFTTAEFTPSDREEITKNFGSFEFEWENVPVFPADAKSSIF